MLKATLPLVLVPAVACTCRAQWDVYSIDSAGTTGSYTSLALTSFGQPRVAYHDATNGDLKHAWMDIHGFWHTEVVDAPAGATVGRFASLCIDGQNLCHIAYQDQSTYDLKYARQLMGGGWDVLMLDEAGSTGYYPSICYNTFDGKVHIAYYDSTNADLRHAWANASGIGGWAFERPDSVGDVGSYCSMAARADGAMYIAYYDATNARLKVAQKSPGGGWVRRIVDDPLQNVGKYTSIAFDPDGDAHISYYNQTDGFIKRAIVNGAVIATETVVSGGVHSSIACDADGVAYIAIYDTFFHRPYVWDDAGAGWGADLVDDPGTRWVGEYLSLKIHPDGFGIVSYQAGQKGTWNDSDLRVAIEP